MYSNESCCATRSRSFIVSADARLSSEEDRIACCTTRDVGYFEISMLLMREGRGEARQDGCNWWVPVSRLPRAGGISIGRVVAVEETGTNRYERSGLY